MKALHSNYHHVLPTDTHGFPELYPVSAQAFQPVRSKNRKQVSRSEQILFWCINAALIFGLAQCVRTVVTDAIHLTQLLQNQAQVDAAYTQTRQEHRVLNDKIRIYSSASGIEELARNYLNMVGENEIPVRFQ